MVVRAVPEIYTLTYLYINKIWNLFSKIITFQTQSFSKMKKKTSVMFQMFQILITIIKDELFLFELSISIVFQMFSLQKGSLVNTICSLAKYVEERTSARVLCTTIGDGNVVKNPSSNVPTVLTRESKKSILSCTSWPNTKSTSKKF